MRITRRALFLGGGLLLCLVSVWLHNDGIKEIVLKKLVKVSPFGNSLANGSGSVIYVLGGASESLKNRFITAADLYKNGLAHKVLIGRDPMMMEYNPRLGRNMTFNEWAIWKLVGLGVEKEDIEPVSIEKRFWGTFSEATSISKIVASRGYSSLILVSSDYHTMRVWLTFAKLLENRNVALYIYTSEDDHHMSTLIAELLKCAIYRVFLL